MKFDLSEILKETIPRTIASKMMEESHLAYGRELIVAMTRYVKESFDGSDLLAAISHIERKSIDKIIKEQKEAGNDLTRCPVCKEEFTDNDHMVIYKNPAGWAIYHGYPEGPGWNIKVRELEEEGVKLKNCKEEQQRKDQYKYKKVGDYQGD